MRCALCVWILAFVPATFAQAQGGAPQSAPATTAAPRTDRKPLDQAKLEAAFRDSLTDVQLRGVWQAFTTDKEGNRSSLSEPRIESYTITSVEKDVDDYWVFHARIQFADYDTTLPVRVRVVWAEDTPIVTLDDLAIPGIGTYSARVMFFGGHYSGTWFGQGYGGVLAGQIVKDAPPRVAFELEREGAPYGRIVFELDAKRAPLTTRNFLRYVDEGYFDGTLIHRVLAGEGARIQVFQGGGYTELGGKPKPGQHEPIAIESNNGLKNERGTIAMARDADPNTATSEFFVNIEANPKLNYTGPDHWGYAVFGRVVDGMEIVDRISRLETRTNPDPELKGEKSQPVRPVVVKRAKRM